MPRVPFASLAALGVATIVVLAAQFPDEPEAPPPSTELPAAVGRALIPSEPPDGVPPAPGGCFVALRSPGGIDLPWRDRLRTGDRLELAGEWYTIVGPAPDGEYADGEWVYLEGVRPSVAATPYRAARR